MAASSLPSSLRASGPALISVAEIPQRSGTTREIALELLLEPMKPAADRHLRGPASVQCVDRAGQEADRTERGVPVRGGEVEHRAGRRNDVARDGRDSEEDAAQEVDHRLPPARAAAQRQPAVPSVAL